MKKKLWYSVDSDGCCNFSKVKPEKDTNDGRWNIPLGEEFENEEMAFLVDLERDFMGFPKETPNNEPVEVWVTLESV